MYDMISHIQYETGQQGKSLYIHVMKRAVSQSAHPWTLWMVSHLNVRQNVTDCELWRYIRGRSV